MNIDVRIGHVWNYEDLPPGTIALDGACPGLRVEPETRRYSFDHHAGCVRLATSATCQQVLDALLLGLDPSGMTVLVNDLDADTVVSVWLLQHYPRLRVSAALACTRRLVSAVGLADAHGPGYPSPEPQLGFYVHEEVLVPIKHASPGALARDSGAILQQCVDRLERWWSLGLPVDGAACEAAVAKPQTRVHGSWIMATYPGSPPSGLGGCLRLYEQGFDRLVLYSRASDGRYRYTIARRSDLVAGFPLPSFYGPLNRAEAQVRGVRLGSDQRWGGGSTIGGGPRDGSVLDVDIVAEIIDHGIDGPPVRENKPVVDMAR